MLMQIREPSASKPWYQNWLYWVLLSPILCGILFCGLAYGLQLPETITAQRNFESELIAIAQPAQTTQPSITRYSKPFTDLVQVTALYTTEQQLSFVLAYYDQVFLARGWDRASTESSEPGVQARYCKDPYEADIKTANGNYKIMFLRGYGFDCTNGKMGVANTFLVLVWSLPLTAIAAGLTITLIRNPQLVLYARPGRLIWPRPIAIGLAVLMMLMALVGVFAGLRSTWLYLIRQ